MGGPPGTGAGGGRGAGTGWGRRCRAGALGVGLALTTVALFLAGGEVYLRLRHPFLEASVPTRFDPRAGILFEPGTTIRWTNSVDYWTTSRANALGFADREPPTTRPAGTCRVAVIGDSFVEAIQVPIEQKLHVVFEREANRRLAAHRWQAVAFARSGTGQANQLAFYDVFARPLRPDVVVLVVVRNDLADNSPLLASVRNGWHPLHPPYRFFIRAADGRHFTEIPIDEQWLRYRVALADPPPPPASTAQTLHAALMPASAFYRWTFKYAQVRHPALARHLVPFTPDELSAFRLAALDRLDDVAGRPLAEGWRYPDDLNMDAMFYAAALPPVFEEALAETGHALDEFVQRSHRDGFHLVALASDGLSLRYRPGTVAYGRAMVDRGYFQRVARLMAERSIPLVDLYDSMTARGLDPARAHFELDAHWNSAGHAAASEALLDYFAHHPEVCGPGAPPGVSSRHRRDGGRLPADGGDRISGGEGAAEAPVSDDVVTSAQESVALAANQHQAGPASYLSVLTAQTIALT